MPEHEPLSTMPTVDTSVYGFCYCSSLVYLFIGSQEVVEGGDRTESMWLGVFFVCLKLMSGYSYHVRIQLSMKKMF